MNTHPYLWRNACVALLAVGFLGGLADLALAAGMGFRNDLNIPIVIQGETVVNKTSRRGQLLLIHPHKAAWDTNLAAGVRIVTIYEANQPNRVLDRITIPFDGVTDRAFAVTYVPVPPGARPKLKLVPLPAQ